jgi:hypothetical protein
MKLDLKAWVIPTSIGVASFALGTGIGYILGKRRNTEIITIKSDVEEIRSDNVQLEFKFEETERRLGALLQQAAIVVTRFQDEGRAYLDRNVDPELHVAVKEHPSNEKREIILTPISNQKEDEPMINVFTNDDDDGWDYSVEVPKRTPNHPYIIHRDEYFSNEMDLDQSSLTFYVGDEILCDEHDVPVYNPEKVVGKIRFGYGSRDPSICYIRNEELGSEYEVIMDHGFYQTEVLGEVIENNSLKHSSKRPLKFRQE